MERIDVDNFTTAVDVALNLTGSIAGLPIVLSQLPVGMRVGIDAIPAQGHDVMDIGQTWTPNLAGMTLEFEAPIFNPVAREKRPFSTPIAAIETAVQEGIGWIQALQATRVMLKSRRI